ncbi:MAG: hypothetical protein HQM06_13525 [Magnetococcales bacterium]|nr:hypothetical protein [Magnetococcales bacterium]
MAAGMMRWYERLSRRERVGLLLVGCALLLAIWYRWQWLPWQEAWQRLQAVPPSLPLTHPSVAAATEATATPWQSQAAGWVPLSEVNGLLERLGTSGPRVRLLGKVVLPPKEIFTCPHTPQGPLTLHRHVLQLTWEAEYGDTLALLHQWQHLPWRLLVDQLEYTAPSGASGPLWRLQVHLVSVRPG